MKHVFFVLVASAMISGCVPTIEGRNEFASSAERRLLREHCKEIAAKGSAKTLLRDIHRDTDEILRLLDEERPESIAGLVRRLKARIQGNTQRLRAVMDPRYTEASFRQTIRWEIGSDEERKLGRPDRWRLRLAKVEAIYHTDGSEDFESDEANQDLLKWVSVKRLPSRAVFVFSRPASSLDLCQMQEPFGMKVRLAFAREDGSEDNERFKLLVKSWREQ